MIHFSMSCNKEIQDLKEELARYKAEEDRFWKRKIILRFDDIEEDLLKALKKRETNIDEKVSLLRGIFNPQHHKELSEYPIIWGGPSVPMIALLGADSGQLYFFALKALLPDVDL